MTDLGFTHEINLMDSVNEYAKRVQKVIDEKTLESVEAQLAEYGYVKVVRCRDCKWCMQANSMTGWNDVCNLFDSKVQSDGFCAWAERKEVDA